MAELKQAYEDGPEIKEALLEVHQSLIQEVYVGLNVLVVAATAGEGLARCGVKGHIERLGIGTELVALQIAPFGAYGTECLLVALFVGDGHRLLQGRLVVNIERDEHVVVA